jgi:DHA1 family inner membrane transport protein
MAPRQISPTELLIMLCAVALPTALAAAMLGPLLVALADEFQASVAVVGQLAAATAITWGIIAPLAGPVSDAYGKRRMLLIGLMLMTGGTLGSCLAWDYRSLLVTRLLTGVGLALVPPNGIAMIADAFPSEGRGKAMGWLLGAAAVGPAIGVPLVAWLLEAGGWQLPFLVVGAGLLGAWLLLWVWCPRYHGTPGQTLAFVAHFREVGAHRTVWSMLTANVLQQMALFGLFTYLAAHLMHTFQMTAGDAVFPLALAGCGNIAGRLLGGHVADHRHHLAWFGLACLGSGVLAVLAFTVPGSPWATVTLASGAAALARIPSVVTPTVLLAHAGGSRTTATGMFAVSNQLGSFGGISLGGLMLALGGFPMVGLFCLAAAVLAAMVIRIKASDAPGSLELMAQRPGHTAAGL